jgi:ATP-binding cassette subfamily F protein uup
MSTAIPSKPILSLQNATKSFGAQSILDSVSLTVHEGDRIGLIGQNGSGKSTLLRIMIEQETCDDGIVTRSRGLQVGLLNQTCRLDLSRTVQEVLQETVEAHRAELRRYDELMHTLETAPPDSDIHNRVADQLASLQHHLDVTGGWEADEDIKRFNVALNLPEGSRVLESLSGGELRRLDLAATLLRRPDLLLLDEPTNHIDTRSAEWIENFLAQYQGSCILVTHDRYFLDRVVTRIVELERRRLLSFPGNYTRFLEYKSQLVEQEAREEDRRQSLLRRELDWMRRGPKARATKQKARKDRFYEAEERKPDAWEKDFAFEIPAPPPLNKRILEAEGLTISRGGDVLVRDFSLIMQKHMRVGIVGPNGAGKTTLLRALMGLEEPDSGTIFHGDATKFLYVDQHHEGLDPEKTVLENVSNGLRYWEVNGRRIFVPSYLEKFLFDISTVNDPMGHLSGGERNRLDLARKFLHGGNFLVLDEPTNDLDLYTLRLLEETVLQSNGPALIVSHDRYFLNRLCTHLVVFEGKGDHFLITGDYDDYLLHRERRRGTAKKEEAAARVAPACATDAPRAPVRNAWRDKKRQELLSRAMAAVEAAEAEVERLHLVMAQPGFYEQTPAEVETTLTALRDAEERLGACTLKWEKLESGDKEA